MSIRAVVLTVVAVAFLSIGALTQINNDASGQTPHDNTIKLHNADSDEAKMFEALLRKDERMLFEAMVNGDVSQFPTLYYNDPRVDLNDDFDAILERSGNRANGLIASLAAGPVGAENGYLTAQVAIILERQDNIEAWEAAQRKAAAEGREPTLADMPNGEIPYVKKTEDQWVDVPFYVFDVKIDGDQATAKLTYEPPETAAMVLTYSFTQVDGRWYISGIDGEYQADAPPVKGNP